MLNSQLSNSKQILYFKIFQHSIWKYQSPSTHEKMIGLSVTVLGRNIIDPLESWKVAWHEYLVVSNVTMRLRAGMHRIHILDAGAGLFCIFPSVQSAAQQPVPGFDTMMIRIMTFITGQFQERSHGSWEMLEHIKYWSSWYFQSYKNQSNKNRPSPCT